MRRTFTVNPKSKVTASTDTRLAKISKSAIRLSDDIVDLMNDLNSSGLRKDYLDDNDMDVLSDACDILSDLAKMAGIDAQNTL